MAKLIGYSLSRCVNDIAAGRVNYDDVEKIISRTAFRTPRQIVEGINDYADSAWINDPERALQIARRLFIQRKVEQPRLEGKQPSLPGKFHWMDSETKQVITSPELVRAADALEFSRVLGLFCRPRETTQRFARIAGPARAPN